MIIQIVLMLYCIDCTMTFFARYGERKDDVPRGFYIGYSSLYF
jgi:hypothetical protein